MWTLGLLGILALLFASSERNHVGFQPEKALRGCFAFIIAVICGIIVVYHNFFING